MGGCISCVWTDHSWYIHVWIYDVIDQEQQSNISCNKKGVCVAGGGGGSSYCYVLNFRAIASKMLIDFSMKFYTSSPKAPFHTNLDDCQ